MNTLTVNTQFGTLTAAKSKDQNYPGIELRLGDNLVAIIEQSEGKIRTIAYTDESDEAVDIIDFNKGNELSEEQESTLETFYNNGEFIPAIDKMAEAEPHKFLWDDFDLLKSHFTKEEEEKLFFYTLVECDADESWIVEGKKIVNRMGYFISRTKIDIPEEGLRYW